MARSLSDCKNNGQRKSKDGFYSGIVILTVSGILVKIVGLLFKIPMNYMIGDTGMGYYNSAYSVYTFFYMLSTSGLPVALSVMISENKSGGKIPTAKSVYRTALLIFTLIGAAVFLGMLFFSDGISGFIRSESSARAIEVVSPAIFFICLSCALRGYFQGTGNMTPIAVSQLIEAVGKLVFGMLAASYAILRGEDIAVVSAYAILGLTVGSFGGALYLFVTKLIRRDRDLLTECTEISYIKPDKSEKRENLKKLIKISLPVTISAVVMSLTGIADTFMIQRVLQDSGMSGEAAATLYGNYTSLAVPMFNLPPILVYPVAYSIVPAISAALAVKDRERARSKTLVALKYSSVISLPCALGMSAMAYPILSLLFKDDSAALAAPLLSILAPSSFFVCLLAVTNSALQGCGKERHTVTSMLCGAAVKLASGVFLLGKYGIYGAPMSTFLCYAVATAINLAYLIRFLEIKADVGGIFIRPFISASVCALSAFFLSSFLEGIVSSGLSCVISITVAAGIYFLFLKILGVELPEEIKNYIKHRNKSEEQRIEQRRIKEKACGRRKA